MNWIAFTVALLFAALLCYVLTERNMALRIKLDDADAKLKAASWLANYHARFTWALQDYLAEKEHVSYPFVYRLAETRLIMAGRSRLNLLVPMDRVPKDLRNGAQLYNADVSHHWPAVYTETVSTDETSDQMQRRLLESGLQLLSGNYRRYAARISDVTKEDVDVIEGILETLDTFVHADVDRMFGMPQLDPEEILPGRY